MDRRELSELAPQLPCRLPVFGPPANLLSLRLKLLLIFLQPPTAEAENPRPLEKKSSSPSPDLLPHSPSPYGRSPPSLILAFISFLAVLFPSLTVGLAHPFSLQEVRTPPLLLFAGVYREIGQPSLA